MKVCEKCKKEISDNMKKCNYCGNNLSRLKKFTPKKELVEKKEKVIKQLEEFFDDKYKLDGDVPELLFSNKVKLQKKNKTKSINIKDVKTSIKEKFDNLKNKKDIFNKKDNKKTTVKKKETKKVTKKPTKKIKNQQKVEEEKLTKVQLLKLAKKNRIKKNIYNTCFVILILLTLGYVGYKLLSSQVDLGYVIDEDKRELENVFNMNEKITYKKISYTILKVEKSQGTSYKKPKKGNEYVIVTINFENNSKEKYRYSSEDWKMINSKEEETGRVITPINAGKALYTGELVVGGTKTASIVFEQPIDDDKLVLRYYDPEEVEEFEKQQELKEEQDKLISDEVETDEEIADEIIEEDVLKPVFSVKIK